MAISCRGISFATPESDFVTRDLFCSIDANNDGVITRDEMLAVAAKFGLNKADTSRLFDLLDTNTDGTVDQAEFSHVSRQLAEVGKNISFASPESDFIAPQENDSGANLDLVSNVPSKVMDMMLFPSDLSFAAAESDFSANLTASDKSSASQVLRVTSRPKVISRPAGKQNLRQRRIVLRSQDSHAMILKVTSSQQLMRQQYMHRRRRNLCRMNSSSINNKYNPSKLMKMLLFPLDSSFATAESDFTASNIPSECE